MDFYYISDEYFNKPEIMWLMKQEHGPQYVVMYQRLCMEAAKRDTDTLNPDMFAGPTNERGVTWLKMMKRLTECDEETADRCIRYLLKLKLIENRNGALYIPEVAYQMKKVRQGKGYNHRPRESVPGVIVWRAMKTIQDVSELQGLHDMVSLKEHLVM